MKSVGRVLRLTARVSSLADSTRWSCPTIAFAPPLRDGIEGRGAGGSALPATVRTEGGMDLEGGTDLDGPGRLDTVNGSLCLA